MRHVVFERDGRGPAPAEQGYDVEAIAASVTEPGRFHVLFEAHFDAIHRYAARNVGSHPADDVVSETFLRAFRTRAAFDPAAGTVRGWLCGIATNVMREGRRAADRRSRAYARVERSAGRHEPARDVTGDRVVGSVGLGAALRRLEDDQREVVLLVGAGLSYQEVAEALRIPIGTVGSRMARARRQLASALGERAPHPRGLPRHPRASAPRRRRAVPSRHA